MMGGDLCGPARYFIVLMAHESDIGISIKRRIPLAGWMAIALRTARRINADNFGLIAAGVAFYALLGLFPALTALTALAGLFTDPGAIVFELDRMAGILPPEAESILLNQANAVAGASDEGLTLTLALSLLFALYLASRATTSLVQGLNIAFRDAETRGVIAQIVVNAMLTIGLIVGALLMLSSLVVLPTILALLPDEFEYRQILFVLRWLVVAVVFISGLAILYRWGPSRGAAHWRWFSVGALLAGVCWFAGSIGFATYVDNFANYNETFGSLGGVIILLTWLWLSAFIVLIGALVDAEIEREVREIETDPASENA